MSGWETNKEEPKRKVKTIKGKQYEYVDNDAALDRALSKKKQIALKDTSITALDLVKEAMEEMKEEALEPFTKTALVEDDALFSGLGIAMTEVLKVTHKDLDQEDLVLKLMTKVMRKIMESKELGELIEVLKDDKE